jgi:sulfate permease, SulP family
VALFLTPLFYNLPEATLAAIVVVAVARMFKWQVIHQLWQVRRLDFGLALVALMGVLTFEEVLAGLLVAVVISLIALVLRASQSRLSVLARAPGRTTFGSIELHPDYMPVPGLLLVRPEEGIYFANAATIRERVLELALSADPPVQTVVVDLEMTSDLDAPSAHELAELHTDLAAAGKQLMLARVRSAARAVLDRSGATAEIGGDNIQPRVLAAVAAHLGQTGGAAAEVLEMSLDNMQRLIDVIDGQLSEAAGSNQERLRALRERLQAVLTASKQA